ncbi:MAG TPA: PaaI family thioesterase [Xanthobacteraceae bacterium]|jgi:uncharacterized protein (TIGR00369 family)|nr:PaaI family thioesterase [Xanthobacteraceae bacterium]
MSDDSAQALARLREEIAGPPFHDVLRPEAIDANSELGTVTIRLSFHEKLGRGKGDKAFHGGVIASLIDLAGHAAVAVKIGRMAPTIDLRIDYMRPGNGYALIAHAKLLKAGRTIARVDIEVRDTQDRIVALGRGTFSTV